VVIINKYFGINDGYGIVGYGYICEKCGKEHRFVSEEEAEVECENCEHVNHMEVVTNN